MEQPVANPEITPIPPIIKTPKFEKILKSPFFRGKWTTIGKVGDTFNPTGAAVTNSSYDNIKRTKVTVVPGDEIHIDHIGSVGGNIPNWVLVDADNKILARGKTATQNSEFVITAPENAATLYIQNNTSVFPTVKIWKEVTENTDSENDGWENISHSWIYGIVNAVRADIYTYIMDDEPGVKFKQTTKKVAAYARNVYKVEPGDKIRFTFQACLNYKYAYYIIGANDMIIAAGEKPSDGLFVDEEIEIPSGAELFVFNYLIYNNSLSIKRSNNNGILHDTMFKDSELLGMSERKNLGSDGAHDKLLTLAWMSDSHGDERNYRRFVEYVNAHAGVIDAVIHTGDMNRMSDTDNGFLDTAAKYRTVVPFMPVMGNHDSHGAKNSFSQELLTSGSQTWQAKKYVEPFMDSCCVRGINSENEPDCYFYRDFDDYKIRVICLHEYDMQRIVSTDRWATTQNQDEIDKAVEWKSGITYNVGDVINYKGMYLKCKMASVLLDNGDYYATNGRAPWSNVNRDGRYFQQEQVDFLISALTDDKIKSGDWGIVIATHQVLEAYEGNEIAAENWHDRRSKYITGVNYLQDGYVLSDIIGAFLSRGKLNKTYHARKLNKNPIIRKGYENTYRFNSTYYPDVVVDVDFGEVTSNSTIICCLNGHTHNCGCYWLNRCEYEGVKHKVLNINQETGCYMPDSIHQATSGTDKFYRFNVSDVIRGGSLAQDCFNIISFDMKNKVVQLLRIGADTTDEHVKRDYARIKYLT